MRNKHFIERFMEENGLEYDVPFTAEWITFMGQETSKEMYISKANNNIGFSLKNTNGIAMFENEYSIICELLFSDNVKIVKKPWKPKLGDCYWYVWFNVNEEKEGNVYHDIWEEHSDDFARYIISNCFKTEKEADGHIDDILKILKGEPLVKL